MFYIYINAYLAFPYRQYFVCSNPEFMLNIYFQNINVGITNDNSKSSVVFLSKEIVHLL